MPGRRAAQNSVEAYVSPWMRRTVDRVAREQAVSISELVRNGLSRELAARGYVPLGAVVPAEVVGLPQGVDLLAVADAIGRDGYAKKP